jgi:hypothetical protein
MTKRGKLSAGDWVEVRSREEILNTLDSNGELENMPFMLEMIAFCGQKFQVYKRAHKTCDTVFPVRGRRVHRAVHLETRCDGQAHGGCQAGCLIFWKEAWLKPIESSASQNATSTQNIYAQDVVPVAALSASDPPGQSAIYTCQATRLPHATARLEWWDVRQYIEDYVSGNVGLWRILAGLSYSIYYHLSKAGIGVGRPIRWLYDAVHSRRNGTLFPRSKGPIPLGQATPAQSLNLQPGELVRVKPHKEILKTLNTSSMNRGMFWDAEMVPYCGGTYRVRKRVTQIIDEKTGRMQEIKTPCVILDGVVCQARYSECRMFCPRSIYPFWREIWLERVASIPSEGRQNGDATR